MSALSTTSVDQLRRLEALSGLVSTMLGTLLLVRAEERPALVRRCACVADGIARDLAQLDGGDL